MKIYFVNLGCPKNQIDLEMMINSLVQSGHKISTDVFNADAVLINTCAFINDAAEEAINIITEMLELKKKGHLKKVFVTGCLPQRYKEELSDALPDVDLFTGVGTGNRIADLINKKTDKKIHIFKNPRLSDSRTIINSPVTGYLRISEGCRKKCAYCVIPQIRGTLISIDQNILVEKLKTMVSNGYREIIIVAEDTSDYGADLTQKINLAQLLLEFEKIEGIKWIRLLYLYPEGLKDDLIDVICKSKKIIPYLDIPFQHSSKKILRLMNRGTSQKNIDLVKYLRKKIKNLILRTTLIVGFPQENETDFKKLMEFVKSSKIENIGAFKYSPEPGTLAATLPGQVSLKLKEYRMYQLMLLVAENSKKCLKKFIGKTVEVLIESYDSENEVYVGRTWFQSPDIDGITQVHNCDQDDLFTFVKVKIKETLTYDLIGDKIKTK